jgi:hypothetical protein
MEIDISEYLSQSEMKLIAETEWRRMCGAKFLSDSERIFSNAAYASVQKMVDEQMGGKLEEIIRDKVIVILNKMSDFNVFKKADAWDRDESKGWTYLQQAVEDNKHLINDRVRRIISSVDEGYIRGKLEDLMYQVIEDRLIGKKQDD